MAKNTASFDMGLKGTTLSYTRSLQTYRLGRHDQRALFSPDLPPVTINLCPICDVPSSADARHVRGELTMRVCEISERERANLLVHATVGPIWIQSAPRICACTNKHMPARHSLIFCWCAEKACLNWRAAPFVPHGTRKAGLNWQAPPFIPKKVLCLL